ncbi:lipid II:glycine glycyltransferase FemX [Leucobacter massiliensis]|uniref:BioF2-like acetyltransferase domain-containing protein n=1 Tax=Leucobacter massiliensis TaxID=1686285 RepID=A0A2S9QRA3_9MICO|nr:GNAT family N-acetyltransferase [Leucobacter massiliensis]PRI12108.1 hypothetical protein B4915_03345 [Leucobacter massiliensis]
MTHFLQQEPWAELQRHLGRTVVQASGEGWHYQAFLEPGRGGSRLYAPYGPVVERPGALREALESLTENTKKLGAVYLRAEPSGSVDPAEFPLLGLRRAPRRQPEHTQIIDIDRPFPQVLAEFASSQRNRHRNAAKKGLRVEASSDPAEVEHLIRLLAEVSARTGMHAHRADYLRATARVLLPLQAGRVYLLRSGTEVIAASLIFDDPDCRYYAHGATSTAHRRLSPGTVMVGQMIEDACASAQTSFDLYGVVPPEVRDHPWTGFSDFKRSFGGRQRDYAGTWEFPADHGRYLLYTGLRRLVSREGRSAGRRGGVR